MFKDNLKSVVINNNDGKTLKSRVSGVYIVINRIKIANVILKEREKSRNIGGRGIIINANAINTPNERTTSFFISISLKSNFCNVPT